MFVSDLTTYSEAVGKKEWEDAMREELKAIQKNNTWELMELPYGKKEVRLKWVYKTRFHTNGNVHKRKVGLVVKGYLL